MYVVFIIDDTHHLINESKIWFFAYNSDQNVYIFNFATIQSYLQYVIIDSVCFFLD